MTNPAAELEALRTELTACVAASETQLSILSAQHDLAFGAIAAEAAALVRNQRKLAEVEDQLARLSAQRQFGLVA